MLIHDLYFQAVNVRHHKVGETDEPAIYRINDDLVMPSTQLSSIYIYVYIFAEFLNRGNALESFSLLYLQDYSIEIYEWSGKSWEPYVAGDVQVQFFMMSPYVLKTLATDQKVFLSQDHVWT